MRRNARALLWAAGLTVVLAACGVGDDASDGGADGDATQDAARDAAADDDGAAEDAADDATDSGATAGEPVETVSVERDAGPGLREGFFWDPGTEPSASIDLDEIISGGPPPDGIPPIDDPIYERIDDAAQWLTDDSPVMVVRGATETKVFPLAIMTWHEIVNDAIDGEPIVVTYCPLCNSGLAFSARIDGAVLDFGTSGRLWRSNLVMYDRQYGNLWTQFTGDVIAGERFLDQQLDRVPTTLQGFAEVRATDPDALVLSRETGHRRDYGRNPYTGYDTVGNDPFLFNDEVDPRFPAVTRVVGLPDGDGTAVTLDRLRDERVVVVDGDDGPVTLWWAPGQASALDAASIDDGRDVGQTAAFVAEVDGEVLEFVPVDDGDTAAGDAAVRVRDTQTGSGWTLAGRAVDGELAGAVLEPVAIDDTFWFVWAVFKPNTEVIS